VASTEALEEVVEDRPDRAKPSWIPRGFPPAGIEIFVRAPLTVAIAAVNDRGVRPRLARTTRGFEGGRAEVAVRFRGFQTSRAG
jgi:hypothetical protein